LAKNRNLLEEIAIALLDREILEGENLKGRLNRAQSCAEVTEWLRTGKLSPGTQLMQTRLDNQQSVAIAALGV
jgi:cell division protease FtsH